MQCAISVNPLPTVCFNHGMLSNARLLLMMLPLLPLLPLLLPLAAAAAAPAAAAPTDQLPRLLMYPYFHAAVAAAALAAAAPAAAPAAAAPAAAGGNSTVGLFS